MIDATNGYPLISEYFVCATSKTANSKWRRIVVNGVVTQYVMNKDGVVLNMDTGNELQGFISNVGYYRYLLTINGKKTHFSKHRLLACLFIPIPKKYTKEGYKQENLTINHKDGVKLNCDLSNLEWVTSLENQLHALDNGLKRSGEDATFAKYKEDDIREVCEMLQKGFHPKDISELTDIDIETVWAIGYGRTWTRVAKDYYFPNFQEKQHEFSVCDDEVVHKICKLLTETNIPFQQIADECGVTKSAVSGINSGRRHKDIVSLYNLPREKQPATPEEKIRHACELIRDGNNMTVKRMVDECGISKANIYRLKNGQIYPDIVKEYGII